MTNTCEIEFKQMDFLPSDMNYFQNKARKIANLIISEPNLLEILSDFLLIFIDKKDFNKRFKIWEEKLKPISESYNQQRLEEFLNELRESYNKIKDDPRHLDKFRGIIFEYIVEDYYKNKYMKGNFSSGCMIIINGKHIKYICEDNQSNNRSTVDIAGHSHKTSEFYEVKVGPNGFDNHVIKYLNLLKYILLENKVSEEIIVGCMTLEKKAKLNIRLRSLNEKNTGLSVYGVNEIIEILKNKS